MADRRLLLVHAHPDDESIWTGATMAAYAAAGVAVTLVTCTLGELGEVIPPGLAHLVAGREDRLGQHRAGELAAACAALGVTDQRFLGGYGRWRDSGMMGDPGNDDPRSFWRADTGEAAAALAEVIREVRPQVVVSYDARGFYGHPDHIQAHRVTRRACDLAAGLAGPTAPWRAAKLYATAMPRSVLAEAIIADETALAGGGAGLRWAASVDELPFGVADEQVTTEVDATAQLGAKIAAMRAHATQIVIAGGYFALSNLVGQRVSGREHYILLTGHRLPGPAGGTAPGWPPDGLERDLFAGL